MFETIKPLSPGMLSNRSLNLTTNQPKTVLVPPVNVNVQSNDDVFSELNSRFVDVTEKTTRYYKTDIIPPTSNAQLLLAMKFFVYAFFAMNGLIFVVAFLIPLRMDLPYGGLDPREIQYSIDHLVIMVIPMLVPLVRCMAFSWSQEFYHYVIQIILVEGFLMIFVAMWWNAGLPLLLTLVLSGIVNSVVAQWFFAGSFLKTVKDLPSLVPPTFKRQIDHTVLEEGAPNNEDCLRLFGYQDQRPADYYRERCGVYGDKDGMQHVTAMQNCYSQALFPRSHFAAWKREPNDLTDLNAFMYCDGVLYLFCCYCTSAFAGLWLGQTVFKNILHGLYMLLIVSGLAVLRGLTLLLANRRLGEALGVAVAEKEFIAHDVVRHQGEKAENDLGYVDINTTNGGGSPFFVGGYSVVGGEVDRGMGGGRLNLTSMWLNVQAVFDFVGASYLATICSNIATESKFMIEAISAFEFKKIAAARWEVSITMLLNSICQMFLLMLMAIMYFGTYFDEIDPPELLIGVLGTACLLCATVKMCEALRFAATILADGESTPRHFCVSETVMLAVTLFLVVFILLFCYLMPIAFEQDFPLGKCSSTSVYQDLFPSACARAQR